MTNSNRISLRGSERVPLDGARSMGRTDPHQLMQISVILKHRKTLPMENPSGRFMTHDEFAANSAPIPRMSTNCASLPARTTCICWNVATRFCAAR